MAAKPTLTFSTVAPPQDATRGIRGRDERPARIVLFTGSGALREVPVTRADLVRMIGDAASVLARLDREEGRS